MTSRKLKPTAGPWTPRRLANYADPGWVILWPDKGGSHLRRLDSSGNFIEEDARLIAEAGTVHHECGLSPRELLTLLQEIVAASESDAASGGEMFFAEAVSSPIEAARAALAKHKEV